MQNRINACAFSMHAFSPTKAQRDFSRGLLTEHRRLVYIFFNLILPCGLMDSDYRFDDVTLSQKG